MYIVHQCFFTLFILLHFENLHHKWAFRYSLFHLKLRIQQRKGLYEILSSPMSKLENLVKCLGCSFPNFTLQLAPDAMSPWHSITLTACPISQFTRRPPTNESAVCSLATNQRPGGRGRAWQLNFPQLTLQQLSCRQCSPRTDAAAATNMPHNLWTKTVSLHASSAAWPGLPSLPTSEAKG